MRDADQPDRLPHPCNDHGGQAAYARRFEEVGGFVRRTNDPRSYFFTRANKRNDYGRDLRTQQEAMICGIPLSAICRIGR